MSFWWIIHKLQYFIDRKKKVWPCEGKILKLSNDPLIPNCISWLGIIINKKHGGGAHWGSGWIAVNHVFIPQYLIYVTRSGQNNTRRASMNLNPQKRVQITQILNRKSGSKGRDDPINSLDATVDDNNVIHIDQNIDCGCTSMANEKRVIWLRFQETHVKKIFCQFIIPSSGCLSKTVNGLFLAFFRHQTWDGSDLSS